MPTFSPERLQSFVQATLRAAGLDADEASQCADAALFADLRGADTHGIMYMVPRTLDSMRQGRTVPGAQPVIVRQTAASALVRGNGTAGPVFGRFAMDLAIEKARQEGIGAVNAYNGNPLGMLGYYPALAVSHQMIGLVMANTPPSAAPWGSTSRVFGTNPLAYAAPAGAGLPILFDIATTAAAAGKVQRAKRRGELLPEGWVIDDKGGSIRDPGAVESGAMLPFGGHKGSGLALLVHLLTGALAGTTVGGEPTHTHPDPERRGQSSFYLAIDPEHFGSRDAFLDGVDRQIGFIHDAQPLPGVERPLPPGERGWNEAERRRDTGIAIADEDWNAILASMRKAHLPVDDLTNTYKPNW